MVEATFIASGKTIEDALSFSADLVHKVLIGDDFTGASKKIDVFCNNIQEANQLDKILWERPKYSIISHNLCEILENSRNSLFCETIMWILKNAENCVFSR